MVRRVRQMLLLALVPLLAACAHAAGGKGDDGKPGHAWRLDGFHTPESVQYDRARQVLYVSNVNGQPTAHDGNGYISRVSLDGRLLDRHWARGLDGPKGMAIVGDRLFVADIDSLVEIALPRGSIVHRYPAEGAKFLNDIAVRQGVVYVSDMFGDAIYRLRDGELERWLEGPELMAPNGLYAEPERLVYGSWGRRTEGFNTTEVGHLKTVDYETGAIGDLGDGRPVGNLDGVEADGAGRYLASDWVAGALYRIRPDGHFEQLLDLPQGSADIAYVPQHGLLLVPQMMDGRVDAYTVAH